jgi:hypothetical protein
MSERKSVSKDIFKTKYEGFTHIQGICVCVRACVCVCVCACVRRACVCVEQPRSITACLFVMILGRMLTCSTSSNHCGILLSNRSSIRLIQLTRLNQKCPFCKSIFNEVNHLLCRIVYVYFSMQTVIFCFKLTHAHTHTVTQMHSCPCQY